VLDSKTIKQMTPFGNLYVTVSQWQPGEPFEVFATIGKAGSDIQAMTEAACRAISQLLRLNTPQPRRERLELIIEQFEGIGGFATTGFGTGRVRSIPDAIAKALRRYLEEVPAIQGAPALPTVRGGRAPWPAKGVGGTQDPGPRTQDSNGRPVGAICPDCGQASVVYGEGCMTCQECGWSQC